MRLSRAVDVLADSDKNYLLVRVRSSRKDICIRAVRFVLASPNSGIYRQSGYDDRVVEWWYVLSWGKCIFNLPNVFI